MHPVVTPIYVFRYVIIIIIIIIVVPLCVKLYKTVVNLVQFSFIFKEKTFICKIKSKSKYIPKNFVLASHTDR